MNDLFKGNRWIAIMVGFFIILTWIAYLAYLTSTPIWSEGYVIGAVFGLIMLSAVTFFGWKMGIKALVDYINEQSYPTAVSYWFKEKVGIDGFIHIVVAATITALLRIFLAWWVTAIVVLILGTVKEWYDRDKTGFSRKDLICDIIGIIIGL